MLDLERIESRLGITLQSCNLAALMMQAAEAMEPMALELDVRLVVEPTDIAISLDSDRITQTLTNLLSNAIKFSPADSDITLSATQRSQDILICIEDSGPGIPADKQEIVFERFQQVDSRESRRLGGTGLGLAICRQIVQQHGGETLGRERTWQRKHLLLHAAEGVAPNHKPLVLPQRAGDSTLSSAKTPCAILLS